MNGMLFLRYLCFLLILFPTILYALLPIRDLLRFSRGKAVLFTVTGCICIILLLSLLGAATGLRPNMVYAISLLPLFLLFYGLSRDRLVKKLYLFLNSTMIITNSIVYGYLFAAPMEFGNTDQVFRFPTSLSILAVAAVLGLVYWKTLSVKIAYLLRSEVLGLNWRFAVLIPLAITLMFYYVTPKHAEVVMTGRVRVTTSAFLILGPLTFLLVYHVFWRIAVNTNENARLKAENELMEMESKRYAELRSYMNETRAMRHDFRQHLLVMDEYAKSGETEKLTDYIRQFTASLADHKGSFAANPAVDAVASHYDQEAEEQNTRIKWLIELPEVLPIPESDFIAIFGNLVENAVHATADLPEEKRNIHVNVRTLSDAMLGLTVKNPYEGTIKRKKDGLPKSTRTGGGVGLSSVEAAVHRYNGTLDIHTEDGVFTVGVLLYLPEQNP